MVTTIRSFTAFTYRGLVEFLVLVEDTLDNLGDNPLERQNAADQLIYDLLLEPAKHQNLPKNLEDRVAVEQRQMRVYPHGKPEAERCVWVTVLWARWVDAKGMV